MVSKPASKDSVRQVTRSSFFVRSSVRRNLSMEQESVNYAIIVFLYFDLHDIEIELPQSQVRLRLIALWAMLET